MNKNVKISVIIPAYNEEEYILTCLKSLARQNFTDFEVIIVDNNSTDKTSFLVKNFKGIKNLRLIKEKSRVLGKVRQVGFEHAKGKILASSDADVYLPKDWLSKIDNHLSKNPEIIAVGGPYSYYDETSYIKIIRKIITPIFLFIDSLLSGWKHHFAACNFAVRRDIFFKIGGFNKRLHYGEDIDLSSRLSKTGRIKFDNSIYVLHSSRRFKGHILKGMIYHLFNYLKVVFLIKIIWPIKKIRI